MSVVLTWLVAQGIANRPYDRELADMVRVLSKQVSVHTTDGHAQAAFKLPAGASEILRADEADDVFYQVLGLRGEYLSGERSLLVPPDEERASPGELRYRDDSIADQNVRVAYMWVDVPGRPAEAAPLVQVAETLGKRSRLATEIIKGVILPQFVILPLAVLLVWLALARGFAPLNELQLRIRHRDSSDLSPIDEREAPEEVSPLVRAINDLLGRLDQSMGAQKHFLADAAHQLKTPLAGLQMQAELAQRDIDAGRSSPADIKRSLQQIAVSSERAAHMVNQLLAMARAEDKERTLAFSRVDLAELAVMTVQDFVPRSLGKRIDLGYEGPQHVASSASTALPADLGGLPTCVVWGQRLLLGELIRNLVDNALQYTPSGGMVTVRVYGESGLASGQAAVEASGGRSAAGSDAGSAGAFTGPCVLLEVEDSGPGISAAEREQVFRPFYRALGTQVDGSGLGLAIVREIAVQHQAEVRVEDAQPRSVGGAVVQQGAAFGPGARFVVRFAALDPADESTDRIATDAQP
jgi:two-component system sensor histidine kinase TctE